ncbi:hypothetical protein [uncultured Winogradskyella sp.]|uniref:hypothetical protein n=1 Tax=uncultured Winogradskyella sp. TaxID=395353 RepID=UPI00262AE336|nr:hypothetical protein [uncultured Winogradskyella sp.]
MLDTFYITIFNYYKKRIKKRSLVLAMLYINFLELAIILALGTFFMAFANQMRLITMSIIKFWMFFTVIAAVVIFKNWMRYNGKKRNILNAKLKAKPASIYLLWFLPFGCLIIAYTLFQVL